MSKFTHEGTEALQHLAEEVEQERKTKGHTPFDDIPDSEERSEDGRGSSASQGATDMDAAARASTFGSASRPTAPGL